MNPDISVDEASIDALLAQRQLLRARVRELEQALWAALPVLWHYAAMNPKWYAMGGSEQDPMGIHALIPKVESVLGIHAADKAVKS